MLAAILSCRPNVKDGYANPPPQSSAFCSGSRMSWIKHFCLKSDDSQLLTPLVNINHLGKRGQFVSPKRREVNSTEHQYSLGTQMHYLTLVTPFRSLNGHRWGCFVFKGRREAPSTPVNHARRLDGTLLKSLFRYYTADMEEWSR